jgi:putative endonuclease
VTSDPRRRVGQLGERLAAHRLERSGYRVLERNYRTREGEIDIVARRGQTLVFCEVKTIVVRETGNGPAFALEAVRSAKRAKIRRLARSWMSERTGAGGFRSVRFDAIGITLSPRGRVLALEHVEAAF